MYVHCSPVVILLLLASTNPSAHGLTCHCHSDNNCAGETECTGLACIIQELPNGVVEQRCTSSVFDSRLCPAWITDKHYCCTTPLCNDITVLRPWLTTTLMPQQTTPLTQIPSTAIVSQADHPSINTVTPVISVTSTLLAVESTRGQSPSSTYMSPMRTTTTTATTTVLGSSVTPSISTLTEGQRLPEYIIPVIAVLVTVLLLLTFFVGVIIIVIIRFNPRHVVGIAISAESDGTPTISTESGELSSDRMLQVDGTTSGSGSGLPILEQRSVATQVTLHEQIGKGRFGEVWKGEYKGDWIAVKVFHTVEEASWFHEVHIYNTCLLRHPNVLRFIAADNKDVGIATQLWLITEYCELGSLYEVLVRQTVDEATMIKLCLTAASGLAHLHSQMTATEGKPPIAHRDIKSRNILVKSDYSCCIADLGLALRYNQSNDTIEDIPSKRVGTRRYLAPEILNESLNARNFDSFKRADMYSFGLVLWETARRGVCQGHAEEYQLPYFDCVTSDPSFDDMKRVVATEGRRPCLSNHWTQSEVFQGLSRIMVQCWLQSSEARLTALRVKKSLMNLQCSRSKLKDNIR